MKTEDPSTSFKTKENIEQANEQKIALDDNRNIDELRAQSS